MKSTAKKMATQVGEMLCVSPETGEKLGIWAVSPDGAIGLGTADGSEFWILESMLHESSEIEVKGLATRGMSEKDELGKMQSWHANEIAGMKATLLNGIPEQGGHVSREVMAMLIQTAFLTGALAQFDRPIRGFDPDNAKEQAPL